MSEPASDNDREEKAKRIWKVINCIIMVLSAVLGYLSLAPDRVARMNGAGWMPCLVLFIVGPGAVLISVEFSLKKYKGILRKPSFDRNPFRQWTDPLQSWYIEILWGLGWIVGAVTRLPFTNIEGVWFVLMGFSTFVGAAIGLVLVGRRYSVDIFPFKL